MNAARDAVLEKRKPPNVKLRNGNSGHWGQHGLSMKVSKRSISVLALVDAC